VSPHLLDKHWASPHVYTLVSKLHHRRIALLLHTFGLARPHLASLSAPENSGAFFEAAVPFLLWKSAEEVIDSPVRA